MPAASGAGTPKQMWFDHDTDIVDVTPPVQNQWYTVFDAEDVRLLWCVMYQHDPDNGARNVEVKWTIDGTVYFIAFSLADSNYVWIWRNYEASTGGTLGLDKDTTQFNAAKYVDKRGQSFKVEIRTTSAGSGTANLRCWCVRETLEPT
jgi:hypothetical protein